MQDEFLLGEFSDDENIGFLEEEFPLRVELEEDDADPFLNFDGEEDGETTVTWKILYSITRVHTNKLC